MAWFHPHEGLCGPTCACAVAPTSTASHAAGATRHPLLAGLLAFASGDRSESGEATDAPTGPSTPQHVPPGADGAPWRDSPGSAWGNARPPHTPTFASSALDRAREWFRQHWLAVVNGIVAAFIGIAILTPVAYAFGWTGPASAAFDAYRFVCAQTPSHSFYIAGYQCCLCARCLSIYCALLLGGLLLNVIRRQPRAPRPLNWKFWVLAMVPMALDGGTQLFGWRESNAGLRILTGIIFGLATAWFMLPQIELVTREEPPFQPEFAPQGDRMGREPWNSEAQP